MERLTERTAAGMTTLSYPSSCYYADGEKDQISVSAYRQKAIDYLAAYEDTGLGPEEVEHIKNVLIGKAIAEVQEFNSIPIKRLQELAQAEKDGRLIVPPCKVGDKVWFIQPYTEEITEETIDKIVAKGNGLYMKLSCNKIYETSCNSIGKTVFLTREGAEAALKKREADNESD